MAIEKAKEHLKKYQLEDRVIELADSSATVQLAAEALGCMPGEIAKTLSFMVDDGPILIVVSGESKVDNRKFKDRFRKKAKMIPWGDVERLTGHPPGGVCPFAVNEGVAVYLDQSLQKHQTVFPAAGGESSAIEMTCEELEKYASNFVEWVDVSKK